MKKFFLPLALVALLILGALNGSGTVFNERSEIHASGDMDSAEELVLLEEILGKVDASASECFYSFELDRASHVSIGMTTDASGLILDLLSSDGERLVHDVVTPFGRSLSAEYDLMAGSYLIRVSTHDDGEHEYSLFADVIPVKESYPESYPGEDESLKAAGDFELGQTVDGQIAQFNPVQQIYDQDSYRFTLEEHTQLLLTFTGRLSVADIQIVDENQTVYFNRMVYETGLDGDGTSWKISLDEGEYFLVVRSTGYESSGTYSFVLDEQDL